MIRTAALLILLSLRIFYQPGTAQATIAPFTSQPLISPAVTHNSSATLTSFTGNIKNNKVFLEWTVAENEAADQFEVERSSDGKNYTLAALVFGTDMPATDKYLFYEKAGNQKIMYRIKLIQKNKKAGYSAVVEVTPNV